MAGGKPLRSSSREWNQICHSIITPLDIAGTTQTSCQTSSQSQQNRRNPHISPDMNFWEPVTESHWPSSVTTNFHNVPVDLPPPPGGPNQSTIHEHSYCNNSNK